MLILLKHEGGEDHDSIKDYNWCLHLFQDRLPVLPCLVSLAAASSGLPLFGSSAPALFGASTSMASFAPAFGASSSAASSGSTSFGAFSSTSSSVSTLFGAPSTSSSSVSTLFGAPSTSSSSVSTFFGTPSSAASSGSTLFGTPSSAASSSPTLFGTPSSAASSGSTLFGASSTTATSALSLFGVSSRVLAAFGVSSSSATTASSVAPAAAASGAVSSSTRFGLSSTSASSNSTGSLGGFQLSTKTSSSSSQAQSTSASPVFEVKRSYKRDLPPAHFMFKIESFSLLLEAEVEKYETEVFEVWGYKWSLIFYPNGNKRANVDDHISLYLVIKETEKLPACWEVNATFKFFVFDHIRDKYLTIEGCKGSMKRFHAMKTEWGFAQFISLESLKNASAGYLVEDSCIFGAEVFVVKSSCKFECLSMIKHTSNNLMTWKIKDFSMLDKEYYESEVFDVKGSKWKLKLYPKGPRIAKGSKSLSLYLCLNQTVSLAPSQKLFAHYKLRIRNQIQDSDHAEKIGKRWFDQSVTSWGFKEFISLEDLKKQAKALIMNDCLMIEAEILYESEVKSLS